MRAHSSSGASTERGCVSSRTEGFYPIYPPGAIHPHTKHNTHTTHKRTTLKQHIHTYGRRLSRPPPKLYRSTTLVPVSPPLSDPKRPKYSPTGIAVTYPHTYLRDICAVCDHCPTRIDRIKRLGTRVRKAGSCSFFSIFFYRYPSYIRVYMFAAVIGVSLSSSSSSIVCYTVRPDAYFRLR